MTEITPFENCFAILTCKKCGQQGRFSPTCHEVGMWACGQECVESGVIKGYGMATKDDHLLMTCTCGHYFFMHTADHEEPVEDEVAYSDEVMMTYDGFEITVRRFADG